MKYIWASYFNHRLTQQSKKVKQFAIKKKGSIPSFKAWSEDLHPLAFETNETRQDMIRFISLCMHDTTTMHLYSTTKIPKSQPFLDTCTKNSTLTCHYHEKVYTKSPTTKKSSPLQPFPFRKHFALSPSSKKILMHNPLPYA